MYLHSTISKYGAEGGYLGTRPVLHIKGRVCYPRTVTLSAIVKYSVWYLVFGIWTVGLYTLYQLNTK